MINVIPGSSYTFAVDFTDVNGEGTAADMGSVTLTMSRNDGVPLAGYDKEPVPVTTGATSAIITIPALENTPVNLNEVRILKVDYTVLGRPRQYKQFYMLKDLLEFPLSPDDVRALLGVTAQDISDSAINIYAAYLAVELDTNTDWDAVVLTGGDKLPQLIEAVKYRAALMSAYSVQSSMMQSEQADNTNYKRFSKIDFDGLNSQLSAAYLAALGALTGNLNLGDFTLAVLTTETDAVTGA